MPADWTRLVNTTIHKYLKKVEVNVLRNRKLLALMESKGRIEFNGSGDLVDWKVQYKQTPFQGFAGGDTLTFPQRDYWKTAQLAWRGYASTDMQYEEEQLKNRSAEAIVKIYSELTDMMLRSITEQFGDEFYVDGNASGNEKRIHGLESFFGVSGAATNGYIATPSDTYAGLSTALGNYGGTWSTSGGNDEWPSGTGDSHYDFWSPLIVDYTDTAWSASTKTWPNTCREALRYGIVKGKKNKSLDGMLDLILLNDELFRQFEDKVDANERIVIKRGDKKGGLYSLGFEDVINFDGVDVTYEYGVPSTVGYGLATPQMTLRCLYPQLFKPRGPDFDIATYSYRFAIAFFGNLTCNPRHFVKFDNVT